MKTLLHLQLVLLFIFSNSCNGQNTRSAPKSKAVETKTYAAATFPFYGPMPNPQVQISQYIRRMFQDKAGNIWFGTNGEGVCKFDGKNYFYYSPTDLRSGFGGDAVRGIVQDKNDNIWFATNHGISRYDGKKFTNYTINEGLAHNQVWSILLDKSGMLWFGTEGGVSRFDGKSFANFALPAANLANFPNAYPASKLINTIFEDKDGYIWFGSNGNGAYRYDGKALVNFSEIDGLCNNFVQNIMQDKSGKLWFATRFGGISSYDGKSFSTFNDKNGLVNNFAWIISEDKAGNLWIGNAGGGLTRYDGRTFTNYPEIPNKYVQSILEDKAGNLWIGTSGGAYIFDGKNFKNITRTNDGC